MVVKLAEQRCTFLFQQKKTAGARNDLQYTHKDFEHLALNWTIFLSVKLFPGKNVCKSVNHGCEHICVSADNSYICKCREGFILREDGKTCRSEWPVSIRHFYMCIRQERKNWKKHLHFDIYFFFFFNMFSFKTYIYIDHSQDGTSANQSAMAVSIFVLTKMTHMFASVMRVFCWEKMGKHAEVSTLIISHRLISTVCRLVEVF